MKFGVMFANTGAYGTADGARALGSAAEAAGFDSIWTVEHVVVPKDYQSTYPYSRSGRMPGSEDISFPDPLIWLAHLAAVTSTVKLATGILIAPQRRPLVLAKQCATLDQLSGGRLVLGVGAGWLEEEFAALDVPFADRGRRLEDHIAALRAAWGEQPASFEGEFTQFDDVYLSPQPANGQIPIVVGGHTEVAARRAGRLGDGFFPGRGSESSLGPLVAAMRQAALEADRDPDAIEITAASGVALGPDPIDGLRRLEDMGIHRVVVPPLTFDPTEAETALADFADRIITKLT